MKRGNLTKINGTRISNSIMFGAPAYKDISLMLFLSFFELFDGCGPPRVKNNKFQSRQRAFIYQLVNAAKNSISSQDLNTNERGLQRMQRAQRSTHKMKNYYQNLERRRCRRRPMKRSLCIRRTHSVKDLLLTNFGLTENLCTLSSLKAGTYIQCLLCANRKNIPLYTTEPN